MASFRELAEGRLTELAEQEAAQASGCPWTDGGRFQRDRLRLVAEWCADQCPAGDFIEIGCFEGETSRVLAEIAARYGRRLICVDPWEIGTQNCSGGEYERFLRNTRDFRGRIDVWRASSLVPDSIARIRSRDLCFAWVDGLHTEEACFRDIQSVAHCRGIIAVDDLREMDGVRRACQRAATIVDRAIFRCAWAREGYLCHPHQLSTGSD